MKKKSLKSYLAAVEEKPRNGSGLCDSTSEAQLHVLQVNFRFITNFSIIV